MSKAKVGGNCTRRVLQLVSWTFFLVAKLPKPSSKLFWLWSPPSERSLVTTWQHSLCKSQLQPGGSSPQEVRPVRSPTPAGGRVKRLLAWQLWPVDNVMAMSSTPEETLLTGFMNTVQCPGVVAPVKALNIRLTLFLNRAMGRSWLAPAITSPGLVASFRN